MKDDRLISLNAAIDAVNNMIRRKFGISADLGTDALLQLPSAQTTGTNTVQVDDCISRQAAIAEIMEDLEDRSLHDDPATPEDYAEGYDEGIRNAAAIVLQMPSAHPGWIPCTPESKPKRCEYYLVTDDGYTEEAYLDCDGVWFSLDGNKLKDVTAWMEKPKPWEGDANGKN